MGFAFDSLLSPLSERLWSGFFRWWDDVEGRQVCKDAISRIENELRNFKQLGAKQQYKSPAHEKAVTQDSFEQTDSAMADLLCLPSIRYRRIRRIAVDVSRLCKHQLSLLANERDATEIVVLINKLVPRLESRTRRMNSKDAHAAPF